MTPNAQRRLRLALAAPAVQILCAAALMLSVVAVNGRPVVFADTNMYDWMGQLALRPFKYALSPLTHGPKDAAHDPDAEDETPGDLRERRTEMGARSFLYGVSVYVLTQLGTLWLLAAVQALGVSTVLNLFWRRVAPKASDASWYGLIAGLCLVSTLPFFAGFAMPDVWTGPCVLIQVLLLGYWASLSGWTRWALIAGLALTLSFHTTHVLSALALLAAAAGICLWRRGLIPRLRPGALSILGAVAAAMLINASFSVGSLLQTGEPLRQPPFLVARLLADGPGRVYLKRTCARDPHAYALCRFAGQPLDDSQDILWSGDKHKGLFGLAGPNTRIRIDAESGRFAIASVLSDPLGQFVASTENFGLMLRRAYLDDPLRDPHFYLTDPDWFDTYIADMVHALSDCAPHETGCRPTFTQDQSKIYHSLTWALAGLYLMWRLSRADVRARLRRGEPDSIRLAIVIGALVFAVMVNAAFCGVLSGPFARYQARIVWLIPLAAGLAGLNWGWRPPAGPHRPARRSRWRFTPSRAE